jgi:hypothetical protein
LLVPGSGPIAGRRQASDEQFVVAFFERIQRHCPRGIRDRVVGPAGCHQRDRDLVQRASIVAEARCRSTSNHVSNSRSLPVLDRLEVDGHARHVSPMERVPPGGGKLS